MVDSLQLADMKLVIHWYINVSMFTHIQWRDIKGSDLEAVRHTTVHPVRKKSTYIRVYRLTQTRTLTFYKTDPSSRQGGRPMTNKTATLLTITKIWSCVSEGLDAKTD
jgi:hypothetical protein